MRIKRGMFMAVTLTALLLWVSIYAADSSYYNQKGIDELRGNSPAKAAEYFLRAISIDPSKKHYHNNLAAAYMRLGEYPKAEECLKNSLKLDPKFAKALSNMSVALFHMGRYRESYRYYQLSRSADREYTDKRFESSRVSSAIGKISSDKPEDRELKLIKEYVDKKPAPRQ